jgi:hypothetical protein
MTLTPGGSSGRNDVHRRRCRRRSSRRQRVLDGVGLSEAAAEEDVGAVQPDRQ